MICEATEDVESMITNNLRFHGSAYHPPSDHGPENARTSVIMVQPCTKFGDHDLQTMITGIFSREGFEAALDAGPLVVARQLRPDRA